MAIKSKELAKKLGVSEATLSLVLNHKAGISKSTRERVTNQVISFGYGYMFKNQQEKDVEPIAAIEAENTDKGNIGFVVYKDTGLFMDNNPFFPLIIDGMDMTARKNGFRLIVINIRRDMDIKTKLGYIKESRCAGYVVYAPELPEDDVDALIGLNIPFVLLDNYFPGKAIDAVTLNNDQGIYIILKMLIEKGHRRIGYLGSGVNIQSFGERKDSFEKYMKQFGLHIEPHYYIDIGYPETEAERGMDGLISGRKDLPTAFITDNDFVAYGAIRALKKNGFDVPKDVSVVGFSDRPVCMYIEPNITTVRIPRFRFGGEAVDILINKIIYKPYDEVSVVKTEVSLDLIMRDSVADVNEDF